MSTASDISFVEATGSAFSRNRVVLTERGGGVSSAPFDTLNLGRSTPDDPAHVRANEARALAALDAPDQVARIQLEHGARILPVGQPGVAGIGDALVTTENSLVLSLSVADCYPVALIEGSRRALVHCGWRCVAADILEGLFRGGTHDPSQTVFTRPKETHVWIGPGIGASCYPVGPEVGARFPMSSKLHGDGQLVLDLNREIRLRLLKIGIPTNQIESNGLCTACHPPRFFSHRRDGFPSGRMAAFFL